MNYRVAYPIIFYKEYRYFYNKKYKDETIDKFVIKHPTSTENWYVLQIPEIVKGVKPTGSNIALRKQKRN